MPYGAEHNCDHLDSNWCGTAFPYQEFDSCTSMCHFKYGCIVNVYSSNSAIRLCSFLSYYLQHLWSEFAVFTRQHRKKYSSLIEVMKRFDIFSLNYAAVKQHSTNIGVDYEMGLNHLSDQHINELTSPIKYKSSEMHEDFCKELPAESKNKLNGRFSTKSVINGTTTVHDGATKSWDWRLSGAVNPPKNQKKCGSCWAFAVAAVTESQAVMLGKSLPSLSEQELIDCAGIEPYDEDGCQGGTIDGGFEFASKQGLCSETYYPYEGSLDQCDNSIRRTCDVPVYIVSCTVLPAGDEDVLLSAIIHHGPLAVAIAAGTIHFQLYQKGIFTSCNESELDHAVVVIGFGTTEKHKYWIVRNSWGADWGENGYIRLLRSRESTGANGCLGIMTIPTYAEA